PLFASAGPIVIRIFCVRASATSKSAPAANHYVSQSKADANKADDASPFALLVGAAAPKNAVKDAGKDTTKPMAKNASQPDDKAADARRQDDKPQDRKNIQVANAPQPSSVAEKPAKADKKDDATVKNGDDTAAGNQLAAALPQLPQQSAPQPDILPQQ